MHRQTGAHDEDQIRLGRYVSVVVERFGQVLAEKDNVWLDVALARFIFASRHNSLEYVLFHEVIGELIFALNAALCGEAAVGFDNEISRDTGLALETVDVLCEEHAQEILFGEQGDEDVGDGRRVVAWIQLFGKDVEWVGVSFKVGNVKDSLGVGKFKAGEVGIEAGIGGAEVGYCKQSWKVKQKLSLNIMGVALSWSERECLLGLRRLTSSGSGQTSACHDNDSALAVILDVLGDARKTALSQLDCWGVVVELVRVLLAHLSRWWLWARAGARVLMAGFAVATYFGGRCLDELNMLRPV